MEKEKRRGRKDAGLEGVWRNEQIMHVRYHRRNKRRLLTLGRIAIRFDDA